MTQNNNILRLDNNNTMNNSNIGNSTINNSNRY